MKYKGSLGVGGVLSAIGLLSVEGAPVPQEKLVDYLCTRFSVDRMDVYDVLDDAECDDLVQKSSDGLRVVDEGD